MRSQFLLRLHFACKKQEKNGVKGIKSKLKGDPSSKAYQKKKLGFIYLTVLAPVV